MSTLSYKPLPPRPLTGARPAPDPCPSDPDCPRLIRLEERLDFLQQWQRITESDLRSIRETLAQVKLLMSLTLGSGGLSLLTLIAALVRFLQGQP
jgi:hypothetical protein